MPSLDKVVEKLREQIDAEKAERQELLKELRRSRSGGEEKLTPKQRMERGHQKREEARQRAQEGGDDGDGEE